MDNKKKIRILIADDHNLFRRGLLIMLEDIEDLEFVGEAESGAELIEKYLLTNPDIVLADIQMKPLSGTEAVKRLILRGENVKALFLSMYEGDEYNYYCQKAGGMGLISKNVYKAELLFAIKTVYSGGTYFGIGWNEEKQKELAAKFECTSKINNDPIQTHKLTTRDRELLYLISEGYTSKEIAQKLFLGKRTIDSYRCNLLKKLGLHSLPELMSYAVKNAPDNFI